MGVMYVPSRPSCHLPGRVRVGLLRFQRFSLLNADTWIKHCLPRLGDLLAKRMLPCSSVGTSMSPGKLTGTLY
jgi:hypothetical protein